MPLYIGDRIGNYRVELELASTPANGMYRAAHVVLPRRAVIKMSHGTPEQPRIVHMLREACILDALHHPGVIRVYDSGLHEGQPWFATEALEGHTLNSALVEATELDRGAMLGLLRDVAAVIEHAWARGVIHCGLRPDRILMTGRTRGYPVCITDWSDARAHDAKPQPFFPCQAAWHYTAPELAAGDPLDDRTDVFAIGVIAYQLFTGRLPFETGILATRDTMPHVPTAVVAPDLPGELTTLIDRMLARDRWERPSAADVCAELESLSSGADATPAPALAGMRIRRPRWTPEVAVGERARTDVDLVPLADDAD